MASMAKAHAVAVTSTGSWVLREDGTVYFNPTKTVGERLCQWGLASLWIGVVAVVVTTLLGP
jgi:hypothetical protein